MKIFPQSGRDIESRGEDLNVTQRLCQDSQGIKQICERFFTYTKEYYERQQHKVPEKVQIFTSDLRAIGECWEALNSAYLAMQILNGGTQTSSVAACMLYSTSSEFTRANPGLQQPLKRRLRHSYRDLQPFRPGGPTDHWPTKVLLAELIVRWGASPLQYIPRELASRTANDRRLQPYMSNLSLPSQPTKLNCRDITWFRKSPVLHGSLNFIGLGMPDNYIHRAEVIQVSLYISPDFSPSPDCLLVFSDPVSLEEFSDRLRHSGTNFRWQSVVQYLGGHIIEDSLRFLTDIANEIHKAKYEGIRDPNGTITEFLLLVEDYLREMPGILDMAVQKVEALAPIEPNSEYEVKLWADHTTDVNYLKESAKKLHNEAAQVKQAVFNHFAVGQMGSTRKLTILASIYIPLSFVASFFAMNFDAVKKPDNNSTLPGLRLFWATAIPLAIGTIILPVIGGKVVRAVVKTNWTILVVFLVDVGMFAVMTTMMTVRPTTGEAMNEVGIWSSLVWYFCLPAGVAIFSASKRLQEMALRSEKPSRFQAFKSMAILDFFMGFFYLFFWMFDFYNRPPAVGYALICFVFCYRFFRFVQNYRRSLRGKL